MRKIFCAAAVAWLLPAAASAAVVSLESTEAAGEDFRFNYEISFSLDEGLRAGDSFTIFDFAGYVTDSLFAPDQWTGIYEVSNMPTLVPGQSNDPGIGDLVFRYTGPDVNLEEPLVSFDLSGFGALSTFGASQLDAFTTLTTKSGGGASGTLLVQGGTVSVPFGTDTGAVVPEPATWAMLVAGFGMVGSSIRRRRQAPGRVSA